MATQIIATAENVDEHGLDMIAWLKHSVGPGSLRQRTNTWLGADDWFYYQTIPELDEEDQDNTEISYHYTFVFRREGDASMFALKWLK